MSEQLKCLRASIVSMQSVPEQCWHRLVSHNCCLAIPGLRNIRVLGRTGENQRKILDLSNLCSKTWISEPGMLVLPVGDAGCSPLSLQSSFSWGVSWIEVEFSESLIQTLVGGCSLSKGKVQVGNSTWPFPPVPGALFPTAWDQPVLNRPHSS